MTPSPPTGRYFALVLAAACLSLAGCGDGDDTADEREIRTVLAELDRAQTRGDARRACSELVVVQETFELGREEAEGEEEEEAEEEGGEEKEEGEESPAACRRAFASQVAARRASVKRLDAEVRSVDVRGETAVATVRSTVTRVDGSSFSNVFERELVRRDDRWRVRISPEG